MGEGGGCHFQKKKNLANVRFFEGKCGWLADFRICPLRPGYGMKEVNVEERIKSTV